MSIAKYLAKLAQGVDSQGQLSVSKIAGIVDTTPTITTIAYPGDDTATDPAGGQTITLTGTNFANGAKVIVNGATAGVVTVVSSTQITFVAPANPVGSYILYVINTNGGTAIAAPGIQYSTVPIFSTAAGTLGTLYETTPINTVTAATSDSTITYYLQSGTLPSGVTLNSSTGTITGTSPLTAASTTYTFTIRATDGQQQDGTREFSLTINPDVITWSNPISNGTLTAYQGVSTVIPITTTTGSGSSVVYSASGNPTGIALSGNTFTGTPTALGSSTGTLTGTTVASNRTSQITFTWTISVLGDLYWPQTTVLLTGTAPSGIDTFVADASLNNNLVTVVGDTRPSKQNPYQAGYYSNYFDGTGDYLSVANAVPLQLGTGDFTIEFWWNGLASGSFTQNIGTLVVNADAGIYRVGTRYNSTNYVYFARGTGTTFEEITYNVNVNDGAWHHIACVRTSGVIAMYVDGIARTAATGSTTISGTCTSSNPLVIGYNQRDAAYSTGYTSNARIVKGTAVYTGNFTVPTSPLQATQSSGTNIVAITTTTSLLTCQSNRLIDNSTNNFAITKAGDTTVVPFNPFGVLTSAQNYGSGYFDGTGDQLTYVNNPLFAFFTSNFTVECWLYPLSSGGQSVMNYSNGQAANSNFAWEMYQVNGTTIQLAILDSDGGTQYIASSTGLRINSWNHIAAVRNGNTMSIYVNGVVGGTTVSVTGVSVFNKSGATLKVSGYNNATGMYTGYVSDFRIINGTAVYTGNFTPPTAPLTAVTNTALLTSQTSQPTSNSMFVDNGPAANLVTRVGNVSQGSLNPYGSGHSLYVNGGGSQGWLQPSGVYAKTGGASSGSVNLTGAFTFEAWVYMTAGGRNAIFGEPYGSAYSYAPGIGIFDTANAVSTGLNPGLVFLTSPISGYGGNFAYGSGLGFPTLNTWTHVAMCRDSSNNWHFYMNGVKGTTANANSLVSANVAMPANNGPAGSVSLNLTMFNWDGYITGGNSTSMAAGFNGYLNDVRLVEGTALYTGASLTVPTQPLTPVAGTVVLLGQDNKFTNFANDKGITFTPTSVVGNNLRTDKFSKFNTSAGSKTPISYSNYFDGTGDYLSTPVSTNTPGWNIMAPSGSGGGTIEAWINVQSATRRIICGCLNIGASYTGWYLSISATGQLAIDGYIAGNNVPPVVNSGAGLVALNTWTHIAVSCVSGAVTFYINGVAYASANPIGSTWQINNTATATMVGDAYTAWNTPFVGYISNLRMINNAALYTGAALTVPSTPLTTTVNTTLLTCQNATISDNSTNAYVLTAAGDARPALANPFGFTSTLNTPYSPTTNTGSAYFDGSGDWLTIPHSPALDLNSDRWTVECWVNMTGTAEMGVMGKRPGANYGGLIVSIRNQRLYFIGSSTNTTWTLNSGAVDGVTPVTPGWWTHIAVVKNGTTVYGFVNGKLDQTYTSVVNLAANTSNLTIGANSVTGEAPASGYISNLRVIKGEALYTQAFSPPTQPPAANKNTVLQLDMDKAAITDATANTYYETVGDARLITESAYNTTYYSNYFDGTGDYLTVPNNAALQILGGSFTLECWVYLTAAQANMGIIGIHDNVTSGYFIRLDTTIIRFYTSAATVDRTYSFAQNTWYHIAVVSTGTTGTLYINGIAQGATFSTNGTQDTTDSFLIGRTTTLTNYLNGYISNLRVVKGTALYTTTFTPSTTPLTAVANTQLLTCQSNSFKDNSANNLTLTRAGDTIVRSFNPFQRNTNTSMYFDGTGDYIYAPTAGGTYNFGSATDFTIEAWVCPLSSGTTRGIFQISATAGGLQASVSTTLGMGFVSTTGVEIYANGTYYNTSTNKLTVGAWSHVALVRSSGVTKLYINGVLETSIGTAGSIADTTAYPNTSLAVGGYYSTSNLWHGYIEDFRVTKGYARYTGTFTPPAFKLANR